MGREEESGSYRLRKIAGIIGHIIPEMKNPRRSAIISATKKMVNHERTRKRALPGYSYEQVGYEKVLYS
jgi:hypothetical protein